VLVLRRDGAGERTASRGNALVGGGVEATVQGFVFTLPFSDSRLRSSCTSILPSAHSLASENLSWLGCSV
jgi:hypothetical protein